MTLTLASTIAEWSQWSRPFTSEWWLTAACAALVGTACGILGCFVVLRRMALIGDALSHAVLPGVVIAFLLMAHFGIDVASPTGVVGLMAGALVAGLTTSVLVSVVSRQSRSKEDSAIGIVFTALFAVGVILISFLPRGTHFDLKCFLFGDFLAVGAADFVMLLIVTAVVVASTAVLYHPLKVVSFDPTLAAALGLPVMLVHYVMMGVLSATVVAGLTTAGVVMVVAMVITPASAAYHLTNRLWVMLVLAAIFGAVSGVVGMSLAFVFNAPTGPMMVVIASGIFAMAALFSPSHGLVFDRLRRRRMSRHFAGEDVLKAVYRLGEMGQPTDVPGVAQAAGLSLGRTHTLAEALGREALLKVVNGELSLTQAGRQRASEMVRAHRLWESYLASQTAVGYDSLHDQAERLEHAHTLSDELSRELGDPTLDPQGKPIPPASG
ncbi:MAG: iron chelate uptake ABC transporter family permease subunit [Phycisphaera sp.]|nr:iron chelate uptake ABC transporter family permease subunit [Phycisphaera sp.]